jgi:hypothetical protein
MRSIEFLREEGPGNDQPMSDAAYAAQRAQGEKNLNAVKGFFGGKPAAPAAANPAPPGTSIDPIVRQRLGYGPATQKEIADYQAANPNYGKLVSSDGRPVQSGTPGVPVAAGGEQAVIKAAQTAALPTGTVDPNAGELGNQTPSTRMPLATAAPPTGTVDPNAGELGNQTPSTRMPSAIAAAVAPQTRLTPGPVTGPVATNSAEADAERDGTPVAPNALDTIRKNAGLVGTQNQAPDAAAQAGRIADRMDAEAGANTAGTEAPAALPTGTVDPNAGELGNQTPSTRIPSDEKYPRPVAPAAPANRDSMPFKQAFADARASGVPTFTWKGKSYSTQLAKQSATPNPSPSPSPAGTVKNAAGGLTTTNAGGAATSVTRNSRPVVPGSLRAIQQNNQAAAATGKQPTVLPAAPAASLKPGLGNSPMRGGQPAQAATPVPAPKPAAPAPAAPATPTTAAGAAAAARAKMGLPNRPVTAPTDAQMAKLQESTSKQSSFEYSVDQMRRMSTMLKG